MKNGKDVKCRKCGETFKRPGWGLKPLEYKAGVKTPGGLVSLGAILACPKCGFEGSIKDNDKI